jgi:hypothetical protein
MDRADDKGQAEKPIAGDKRSDKTNWPGGIG